MPPGERITQTLRDTKPRHVMALRPGRVALELSGQQGARWIELERPHIILGAHERSDVLLEDPSVSARHCELDLCELGIMLRDCGSKNGTWLGSTRIDRVWLRPGTHFRLGHTTVAIRRIDPVRVRVSTCDHFGEIYGVGLRMGALLARLEQIATAQMNVLVSGESGTGKELVARTLHEHSARSAGPLVPVDCPLLGEDDADALLFGSPGEVGLLEQANGGTLLLDEVGLLRPQVQLRLRRVLQTGQLRRKGETHLRPFDARIIATSSRDLAAMMMGGHFRQDLFYGLVCAHVHLPPLRDRGEDNIARLADLFLARWAPEGTTPQPLGRDVHRLLAAHTWPGNVRELENVLRGAAELNGPGRVRTSDISLPGGGLGALVDLPKEPPASISSPTAPSALKDLDPTAPLPFEQARREFARRYATRLMTLHEGNQSRAAAAAGVHRNTFRKMLGIDRQEPVSKEPHDSKDPSSA